MPEEKLFIGVKVIKAYQISECEYLRIHKKEDTKNREDRPGYCVKYDNNYVSWSPKDVFEMAYREVTQREMDFIAK